MAEAAGCSVRVAPVGERPWASATFVGALHVLAIEADEPTAFDAWLDALGEAAFAVTGHVVVDVAVERQASGARVTALVLDWA